MLINDLTLLLDLFGNSEGTKLLIRTVISCLVFTAPEKWRVELRAKTGHYRTRCFPCSEVNVHITVRHKNSFLLGFFIWVFGVSYRYFCQWQDWNSSKITLCGESTRVREVKQFSCDVFFFNTQSWRTVPSFGHYCVPMHTNLFKILGFSCQGKSRDIVNQRICLFLWLIFAQHGLFEIQLSVYSAL